MGNGVYKEEKKKEEIKIGVISENTRDFLENYYTGRKLKILERALNRRDIDALKEMRNDPTLKLVYDLLRTIRDKDGNYVKNEDGKLVYAFTKREVELFKKRFAELEKKKVPVFIAEFKEDNLYPPEQKITFTEEESKRIKPLIYGAEKLINKGKKGLLNKSDIRKGKEILEKMSELTGKSVKSLVGEMNELEAKQMFREYADWAIEKMKKEEEKRESQKRIEKPERTGAQKGNISPEAEKAIKERMDLLKELIKKYQLDKREPGE